MKSRNMGARNPPFRLIVGLVAALTLALPTLASEQQRCGYLEPGTFDVLAVLPPAPVTGDPRYEADRNIFRLTRRLVGTPRWNMATNDVKTSSIDMMRDFSCAVGVSLTPVSAPHLAALVKKAGVDTGRGTNAAKNHYKRLRPFKIDRGPICQPASEVADSFDYPSGHTTWGWTWAMILAELLPDRAAPILARGRAYGESRIVCGMHNASAVEGGRLSAAATLSVVRATSAYKADLEVAQTELEALRQSPAAARPQGCDIEARLVAQNIFEPASRR
jgi:acid phosphatase (class A)